MQFRFASLAALFVLPCVICAPPPSQDTKSIGAASSGRASVKNPYVVSVRNLECYERCSAGSSDSDLLVVKNLVHANEAAALCNLLGYTLAEVSEHNWQHVKDVTYACAGASGQSWVASMRPEPGNSSLMVVVNGNKSSDGCLTFATSDTELKSTLCAAKVKCPNGQQTYTMDFESNFDFGPFHTNSLSLMDQDYWIPSGYRNGVVSPRTVGFFYREEAFLNKTTPFAVLSVYVTAAWNDGLTVTFVGMKSNFEVARLNVVVNTSGPKLVTFPAEFNSIDLLRFIAYGGVDAGLGGTAEYGVLDDMTFCV